MRPRASGHIGVGATSTTLGALALAAGIMRPAWLQAGFAGTPIWALVIAGGGVLSIVGAVTLVLSLRRVEEPEPEVPAHVAFASRMVIPDAVPGLPSSARSTGASAGAATRLPTPAPVQQRRLPPPRPDLAKIDVEIRELTKKINKAGVMLATGQLSQQGYLAYVEDLKRQRGMLEAQRVRAEIS